MLTSTTRRLLTTLAAWLVLATAAAAEPAIWAIRDADSTIYLFGTIHALKPDVEWRSPKVAKAFGESGELVVEVVGADDPAKMQPLIMKYGVDPTTPLSAKISAQDRARLAVAAQSLGASLDSLEPMRPWLVSVMVGVQPMLKAGYDPSRGVEAQLTADAKAAGKSMGALETLDQQIGFFAGLSRPTEVALLSSTLDEVDEGPAEFEKLVGAWAAGDTDRLKALFVDDMRRDYPELYRVLIVQRNAAWAAELKRKLAGSGVSFVAVGAGHLVGPDSVQAQLAKIGVKAERR